MVKWTGRTREEREERLRSIFQGEADRDYEYRRRLKAIKATLDLWGEEALTAEEMALVEKHRDYFYPKGYLSVSGEGVGGEAAEV